MKSQKRPFSSLGKRIREIRGNDIQKQFSSLMDVSLTTLKRYESGESCPDAEFIASAIKHKSVNANWLITGKGSKEMVINPNAEKLLHTLRTHTQIEPRFSPEGGSYQKVFTLTEDDIDSILKAGEALYQLAIEVKEGGDTAIDQETLAKTIELVQKIKRLKKLKLTPEKEAKAITLLYRLFQSEQEVDEETVSDFMDMVAV